MPRGAWILFLGTFLNKFGTFVLPFLAIYMGKLGYSAAQAGLAIGGYGVGTLCASLLGGYLADCIGRRRTIILSMFSVAFVMLSLSQARSFWGILILATLAGLTGELYRPASSALLADLVPAGQRVTAFAAYRLSFNAGWAFGPAVAGFLAHEGFVWLFVGDAATSLLYGIVAWLALPSGLKSSRAGASVFETFRVVREDARFRQVLLSSLLVGFVFVQAFSTMGLAITNHGYSSSVYGVVLSLNGMLVVLCELPLTTFTKRRPARRMMSLGYALIGLGFATNLIERSWPMLFMTTAMFTFGEMIAMPVAGAYVADLAPADQRGLYMGTYGLVWALAFVFGPSLGMLLFSYNPAVLWSGCAVLGVVAASLMRREVGSPKLQVLPGGVSPAIQR